MIKRDIIDADDIIPISECADIVGITESRIRVYVRRGDLGRKVPGVALVVTRAEASAFSEIERPRGRRPQSQ